MRAQDPAAFCEALGCLLEKLLLLLEKLLLLLEKLIERQLLEIARHLLAGRVLQRQFHSRQLGFCDVDFLLEV